MLLGKIDCGINTLMIRIKPLTPLKLKSTLYEYQQSAVRWCSRRKGGVIAAGMGTGKTLIALGVYSACPVKSLYVCPKSLVTQIRSEYERHVEGGMVHVHMGRDRHNSENTKKFMSATFVITTYDVLVQDTLDSLSKQTCWGHIFLDEAHTIRNPKTLKHKACMKLIAYKGKWCLTGTPVINNQKDLQSLITFIGIDPYDKPMWWRKVQTEALAEMIDTMVLYINKEDVLTLPPKTVYYHSLEYTAPPDIPELHILAKITRLKQHSVHPWLISGKGKTKGTVSVPDSSKFLKALQIIESAPAEDKILVFSQYTSALELFSTYLSQHGVPSNLYHGGQSSDVRASALNFSKVLLLSLNAGSVGLNITQANHVIFLEPWWNQPIEEQAADRAHRIGQKKEVHVHHLISMNSLEHWIYKIHLKKPSTKTLPPIDLTEDFEF